MTMKNSYSASNDGTRILRILLWVFAGIMGLAILCCVCTLAFAWYTGDIFVDFLRSIFQ